MSSFYVFSFGPYVRIQSFFFKMLISLSTCAFFLSFSFPAAGATEKEIEDRINDLLKKMSLEEKVGQMTQVTLEVVSRPNNGDPYYHELDEQKLIDAITHHHVGSILNIVSMGFTVEHWQRIIRRIQTVAMKKPNPIPVLYGIDAIHGANYTLGATLFPQPLGMAATWNADLLKRQGEITALEIRASGIPWNFYPDLDVGRQPLWPRFWETFGEDVYLTTQLGLSYIQGHQGDNMARSDKAAVCLKHYVGYSFPWSGRDRTVALIPERMLREIFLPPFEAAIKAGAPTIMVNSAEIDGIPGHANDYLLTQILRKELNFKGIVVSDWEDIKRLHTRDRVAATPEEAVRMAVMAGVDMSMVPSDFSFYDILLKLVKTGQVPQWRIDEAVKRILSVKFQLGLFERPFPDERLRHRVAEASATQTNRQAAEESITLLKNDHHLLPLSKETRVLVTGPTANSLSALNGGWTITWQGDNEALYPKDKKTILKAIQDEIGESKVKYVPGAGFDQYQDVDAAVRAAYESDVAIICLGEKPYTETVGNIDDLTLEWPQIHLALEIMKTGKPVILVMVQGRPRIINHIAGNAKSILMAYLPGMEGGEAIANILFGDVNPSGKLPFSYPQFPHSLVPYDHKPLEAADGNRYSPQFPFGHGLSYTQFEYSQLSITQGEILTGQNVTVRVRVSNVGQRTGKEIVQLYLTDLYGSVSRPVKQIKGFTKIELQPGEGRQVEFTLTPHDLSFIGRDLTRIVEPGEFKVTIGPLEKNFVLH